MSAGEPGQTWRTTRPAPGTARAAVGSSMIPTIASSRPAAPDRAGTLLPEAARGVLRGVLLLLPCCGVSPWGMLSPTLRILSACLADKTPPGALLPPHRDQKSCLWSTLYLPLSAPKWWIYSMNRSTTLPKAKFR